MSRSQFVPSRRHRPTRADSPRIVLLCPDSLGVQVLCVEDSLRTRGYRVQVEQGRRARRWVRNVPPGPPTIRVLCVHDIDPVYAQRLCHGRSDFHIVAVTTPLLVVEEIEQITGHHRSIRTPRPSRMILPQPTLIEQSLHSGRRLGQGLVTAMGAVALVAVGGMFGAWIRVLEAEDAARPVEPTVVRVQADETVAPQERVERPEIDEPVLSAVAPVDSELLLKTDQEDWAPPGEPAEVSRAESK